MTNDALERIASRWRPIATVPTEQFVLALMPRADLWRRRVIIAIKTDSGEWHGPGWRCSSMIEPRDTPLGWMPMPMPDMPEGCAP